MTDPWLREDNPFNLTAAGYLGDKRSTMLSNHLLQRGAVSGAMTTADELRMFRKTKRQIKSLKSKKPLERPLPKVFKPLDVFGRPNIPTSNMVDILTSGYQRQWLRQAKPGVIKRGVNPNISTFRSQKALDNATLAGLVESSGRQGEAGQGIPKNTPHEHAPPPLPRE